MSAVYRAWTCFTYLASSQTSLKIAHIFLVFPSDTFLVHLKPFSNFIKIVHSYFSASPTHFQFSVKNIVNKLWTICAELRYQFNALCFTSSWEIKKKGWGGGHKMTALFVFLTENKSTNCIWYGLSCVSNFKFCALPLLEMKRHKV